MNSRKLFALFMVLALTGSALAAQQQRLYKDTGLKAKDVTAVQQHSVFIEIVVENQQKDKQIHKFAAVVGLIKQCKQVRNNFDNAVLWFNDQFLFGTKDSQKDRNVTPGPNESGSLGYQPNVSVENESDGFFKENNTGDANDTQNPDPRWGGCFTPDGFAHAIGADDPFGTFITPAGNFSADDNPYGYDKEDPILFGDRSPDDNIDVVKELIDMDNDCAGCIFEYEGSFFVVDPNDHEWIVDKYVYPLSVLNNLFSSGGSNAFVGGCESNQSDETEPTPFTQGEDPRYEKQSPDRCEDDNNETSTYDDKENHCDDNGAGECGGDKDDSFFERQEERTEVLVEPLFTTHLQTDPTTPTGLGFADEAEYRFENSNITREGAPYPREGTGNRDTCKTLINDSRCAIEYNFLLAVDFGAFDDSNLNVANTVNQTGEDEIAACGDSATSGSTHGDGQGSADQANEDEEYWQGNSHPHNPQNVTDVEKHCHDEVNLDVFFYSDAPQFTKAHKYWSDNHGTPVSWGDKCRQAEDPADRGTQSEGTIRDTADSPAGQGTLGEESGPIDARTPIVCDSDADANEFHKHDGTQSPGSYN